MATNILRGEIYAGFIQQCARTGTQILQVRADAYYGRCSESHQPTERFQKAREKTHQEFIESLEGCNRVNQEKDGQT